ncbi:hypothetical protein JXA84_03195 [candidate division WOR-3 bacterium]|nr:hypothetical protein [candidate division WOR-3 bacterium]
MKKESSMILMKTAKNDDELTQRDIEIFQNIIRFELLPEEIEKIINPPVIYTDTRSVLAIHWHPENVPIEIAKKRIQKMFPNKIKELIIPTQHNQILSYDDFSGVEVDCFAKEFNKKVQLLLHFKNAKLDNYSVLRDMLSHTFNYRSSQLNKFIDSILNSRKSALLNEASKETGTDTDTVYFVSKQVLKVKKMMQEFQLPPDSKKNKLLSNFIIAQKDSYPINLINKSLLLLSAVKRKVKKNFNTGYFFRVQEIIEETRKLGGCVIVPHPEQFWPILLADYDVDGYEIWNPQSREFTEFLISVIKKKNSGLNKKPILATMGDDTHLGEKIKSSDLRDPEKLYREVGFQPAWYAKEIQKKLKEIGSDKDALIDEYSNRLN